MADAKKKAAKAAPKKTRKASTKPRVRMTPFIAAVIEKGTKAAPGLKTSISPSDVQSVVNQLGSARPLTIVGAPKARLTRFANGERAALEQDEKEALKTFATETGNARVWGRKLAVIILGIELVGDKISKDAVAEKPETPAPAPDPVPEADPAPLPDPEPATVA